MKVNKFRRGQIWWYKNNATYDGNIQGKTRPMIIVSNNVANQFSSTLMGVPCTTAPKKNMPTHIELDIDGTMSTALCENIMSLNVAKLDMYIGTCDEELMEQLNRCIMVALALDDEPKPDFPTEITGPIIPDIMIQPAHVEYVPYTEPKISEIVESKVDTVVDTEKPKRTRKPNFTDDEKTRFLNDCETHDADFMIKKYNLKDKLELAKKKYSFKKALENKGEL